MNRALRIGLGLLAFALAGCGGGSEDAANTATNSGAYEMAPPMQPRAPMTSMGAPAGGMGTPAGMPATGGMPPAGGGRVVPGGPIEK